MAIVSLDATGSHKVAIPGLVNQVPFPLFLMTFDVKRELEWDHNTCDICHEGARYPGAIIRSVGPPSRETAVKLHGPPIAGAAIMPEVK